jgi:hypothetical protein
MQSYWFQGNNYDFVYLVNLIRQAERYCAILADPSNDDNSDANDFVAPAQRFFKSFAGIAEKLWNIVVDPFRKFDKDMDDFIDEKNSDDDVDLDDANEHRTFHNDPDALQKEMDEAAEMAAYYTQLHEEAKQKEADNEDEDEDELVAEAQNGNELQDTSSSEEERDDEEYVGGGIAEESSSEVDEWEQKQKKRRGAIGHRRQKQSSRRRRHREDETEALSSAGKRRRLIILESDSDGT